MKKYQSVYQSIAHTYAVRAKNPIPVHPSSAVLFLLKKIKKTQMIHPPSEW